MTVQTGSGDTHAVWTLDNGWLVARTHLGDSGKAQFDAAGNVVYRTLGCGSPTDAQVAAWAADAPAAWAELHRQGDTRRAAAEAAKAPTVTARYRGTCAVSGRWFAAGTAIRDTAWGWAIADARTAGLVAGGESAMMDNDPDWLSRQMERPDSIY